MKQEQLGSFKPSTTKKYVDFLMHLCKLKQFSLREECALHGITMSFPSWLIQNHIVLRISNGAFFTFNASYTSISLDEANKLINEFDIYNKSSRDKCNNDKKDLEYYQANKEFLIDTRTMSNTPVSLTTMPKELRYQIATLAAEYADLAIKSGKKDIKGFVYHLFTLD